MNCRILITTECNLKCKYCCNLLPEIKSKIKFITFNEIIKTNYTNYSITGGEPLLCFDKLIKLLKKLPKTSKKYLYTNGWLLNNDYSLILRKYIDGINLGYHGDFDMIRYKFPILEKNFDNVRLLAEKGKLTKFQKEYLKDYKIILKEWVRDACETNEDIYVI
jgi:MoaA/NifB/PqqE/SkfB family radical SAM enzyme